MELGEIEKAKGIVVVQMIEYLPNGIVSKTIVKKPTGNVTIVAVDSGEGFTEKTSPFDAFAQIIEGSAEIIINGNPNLLETGEAIIIPAHTPHIIKAEARFKMTLTIIKSGYE
ncbi:quercetin dioxygenase-like cupin family protein [Pedobacter sp. UYEF25]